ncbi:MAG: carboxypeptidase regulatory-like domain-containing protein [Nitrospirota bacterium]
MKRILVFVMALSLLLATTSFAYEVVAVKDGGSIKGNVKAAEKVKDPVIPIKISPKEKPEDAKKIKERCGESQQAKMYIISPDNGVKNVVVVVEDVKKGKAAPKTDVIIDNKECCFEPLVGIAYKGGNFVIKNSDPFLHNTNLGIPLDGKRRTVYNLALPRKDQVIKKPIRAAGLHQVKCDAHEWMRAYVHVSDHPYVAITDANGNFEIKDLLPGKYKVKLWHEGFGEVTKAVEVSAGKTSELNVTLKKK